MFGIGDGVTVRSIIILPTSSQWGCMINLVNGKLIAPAIETLFPLMFEQSKNALPEGEKLMLAIFGAHQLITRMQPTML